MGALFTAVGAALLVVWTVELLLFAIRWRAMWREEDAPTRVKNPL